MDRLRSLPRWAIGVLGGVFYAALWWGAVLGALWLAVWRADPPDDPDVVSMTFETFEVAVLFLLFVVPGLVVAHAVWAGLTLAVVPGPLRPRRIPIALLTVMISGVALPLLAARAAPPVDLALVVVATAIVPAVAAWWLAESGPPPARLA